MMDAARDAAVVGRHQVLLLQSPITNKDMNTNTAKAVVGPSVKDDDDYLTSMKEIEIGLAVSFFKVATHCTHSLRSPTRAHTFSCSLHSEASPHSHRSARARTSQHIAPLTFPALAGAHITITRSLALHCGRTHTCPLCAHTLIYGLHCFCLSHISSFLHPSHPSLSSSLGIPLPYIVALFCLLPSLFCLSSLSLVSPPSPSRSPSNGLVLRRLSKGGGCEERREKDRRPQRGAQAAGQEGKGTP